MNRQSLPLASLLTSVALLNFIGAGSPSATQAAVLNVPAPYPTIQSAIDAASPGDVVQVANGTYSESLDIYKALTLEGASEGGVVIDASSFADYGIDAALSPAATAFTFRNFTLLGNSSGASSYGLKIAGDNVTALVEHVTISGTKRSALDLNGLVGGTVQFVTLSGAINGVGLGLTDCDNVILDSITTSGNAWGGIAVYTSGAYFTGGSNGVTLQGANSLGEAVPFYTEEGGGYPITGLTVPTSTFNYLVGNTVAPTYRFYYPSESAAEVAIAGSASPSTGWLQNRTTLSYLVSPPHGMTLTTAMSVAPTGGAIQVRAGTLSGNLSLNKQLTLSGAKAGVAGCGRVVGAPNPTVETVLTAPSGVILTLASGCAGSVIDGFCFSGATRGIESVSGPLNNLRIVNNAFVGQASAATFLNDPGVDIDIDQNEMNGAGGSSTLVHFDQDLFNGLRFTNNCVINRSTSTGLFVDGNHNIGPSTRAPAFAGNVFSGNTTGANLGRFAFHHGSITGNTFSSNAGDGLQGGIQFTSISGNSFTGNGGNGLALTGFGGAGDATRGAQNSTITGNNFSGNVNAGVLYSSGQFPGTIKTNVATGNNFTGNPVGVRYAGSESPMPVTCNWWNSVNGPDAPPSNPNPSGDDIVGTTFSFAPWLTAPAPGGSCNGYGPNNVAANTSGLCISSVATCVNVPVVFNRADTTPARGISVTFQISTEIQLCVDPLSSIHVASGTGSWWNGFSNTNSQIVDNGGGSYTVDLAILGTPCGPTTGGTLFSLDLKKTGADGTGTITVTNVLVRDCLNAPLPGLPGAPATITIDTAGPTAVANLASAQKKTGNDSNGTTQIQLTFTAPGDAATTEVYRKGYGQYPEYDDCAGSGVPTLPTYVTLGAQGWTLTGVTATGQYDEPATRDFWYYVVFTKDACGNVSSVSNLAGGTLNYHLGDVSDGVTPGAGDNLVNAVDVSLLGAHYGITLSPTCGAAFNYLDVGPTTDFSVNARPTTDNKVNFEDLIMFAINYGTVSFNGPSPSGDIAGSGARGEQPKLALAFDPQTPAGMMNGTLTARLNLIDNVAATKGIHGVVAFDRAKLELVSSNEGAWLAQQNPFWKAIADEKGVAVDAAALGNGVTLHGSGEVAVLTFRVKQAGARPTLATSDLRDADNRFLADQPAGADVAQDLTSSREATVTTALDVLTARPNPFRGTTEISFSLASAEPVELRIYDAGGRTVRTLATGAMGAGAHTVTWDGSNDAGLKVGPGVYFSALRTQSRELSRKVLLVK